MIFYLIVFLSALLLVSNKGRVGESSRAYWFGVCILFFVSAFRFDVGQDFLQFYTMEVPSWEEISILPHQIREGNDFNRFGILVKLIYLLSDYVGCRQLVFIITSGIIYFGIGYVIKHESSDPVLSWGYFVGFMLVQSYNMIWQMSAMVIVLLSFGFVKRQLPLKFTMMILLATAFHSSAIVGLLIYPLYHKVSVKWMIIGSIVVCLSSAVVLSVIESIGFYSCYLGEMDKYPGGEKLRFVYPVLLVYLGMLGYVGQAVSAESKRLFVVVIAGLIPPFLIGAHLGNRVGYYFTQFLLVLVPLVMGKHILQRAAVFCLFVLLFFVTVWYAQYSPTLIDTHIPYRNVFTADKTYFRERSKE